MRASVPIFRAAIALSALARPAQAVTVHDHLSPSTRPGLYVMQAAPVFEMKLQLHAGQAMRCETRNLTAGADPVLHVLQSPTDNGPVTEIAHDDDSAGSLNARVTFATLLPKRVTLVMRAAWNGRSGAADLYCDDRLVAPKISVGGAFKRLEGLTAGETLRVVSGPGGAAFNTLYLLDDDGRMKARYVSGSNDSAFAPGGLTGLRNAMIAGRWPDATGELHLIRNDANLPGHDPDGDGLGTQLEAAIGTCSSRTGMVGTLSCAQVTDPRDTDGDGLPDGLEVIGIRPLPFLPDPPFLALPRWGADPRHKDVFIEVDFGKSRREEPAQRMSPYTAQTFAAIYADAQAAPVTRTLHARQLHNPDLQPGVSVHFDIGVDPPAGSSRATLVTYGDWGGFSTVEPVCDGNGCQRAQAANVYDAMMDPNRRGVFHYALGDPGSGGQAAPGIALNLPMGNARAAAHEFGHTLDLAHEGKAPGLNCSPAYPSLMNYAFLSIYETGFADGLARPAVNDVHLAEAPAVADPIQAARFLHDLKEKYGLEVDQAAGNVDWNRDGVYSSGMVRANANLASMSGGGCESTRDSQMTAAGLSVLSPALVHLGKRTLLLYIDEASQSLRLDRSRTALDCPKLNQDCGGLEPIAIVADWNHGLMSVDATALPEIPGRARALVAFRTAEGVFEAVLSESELVAGPLHWSTPIEIPTDESPTGEIGLTGKGGRAWLSYRTQDGSVYIKARDSAGQWSADELATDGTGAAITLFPDASPNILLYTTNAGVERLLGAFPRPSHTIGDVTLFERSPNGGPWTDLNLWAALGKTRGRPALAAEPVAAQSLLPAKITMLSIQAGGDNPNVVMQTTLVTWGIGPAAGVKLMNVPHDNVWLFANGVDLLFEPGIDTNLRAAISTALIEHNQPAPHHVWLRPKADGIIDFDQKNFSDWAQIGKSLCPRLREQGAAVTCPPE